MKTKLAADDTVKAYQVDVDTRNGVVTLSGAVETTAAKEQAILIARGTDGVRDVIDQIRVDEAAATAGVDVDVDVDDDLERRADRAADEVKQEGREAADKIGDAADRTGAAVTDAAITSAVKAKFLADTAVSGLKIDVDTSGGMVTLNGMVSSRAEADRAMTLARNTQGVKGVNDNLKVGR